MTFVDFILVHSKKLLYFTFDTSRIVGELVLKISLHTLRSNEYKRHKVGLFTQEIEDELHQEIHLCLGWIDKDCSSGFNLIIRISYNRNDEVKENNRHGKDVDEPEDPYNYYRGGFDELAASKLFVPGGQVNARDTSDRVKEDHQKYFEGCCQSLAFIFLLGVHNEVYHAENIDV